MRITFFPNVLPKITLFFLASFFLINCNSQIIELFQGQKNVVDLKITNQSAEKCNVDIKIQGMETFQREVSKPNYQTQIEITPKDLGPFRVEWFGKLKIRGFFSVLACDGSGKLELNVKDNKEELQKKWDKYFSEIGSDKSACVKYGLENLKNNAPMKTELADFSIDDENVKTVLNKCEAFFTSKNIFSEKGKGTFECKVDQDQTSQCEATYAEITSDGKPRYISKSEAIKLHFENKPWVAIQKETDEAKKLRIEKNERDKKNSENPQYRKQQAEIEKARLMQERFAEDKIKKEQAQLELLAKQEEKKRLAEEKEEEKRRIIELRAKEKSIAEEQKIQLQKLKVKQEEKERVLLIEANIARETEKKKTFEKSILRLMISQSDPRLSCQSKWISDSRFNALSEKISLNGLTDVSFQMLADTGLPTSKDQQTISTWADEFKKCIFESSSFRTNNYSKELNAILEKEDNALIDMTVQLYLRKITYGSFNTGSQQISKDTSRNLNELSQKQDALLRSREAALKEAQFRQDQQRQIEMQRQNAEQQRQYAEQQQIASARRQWQARCEFDQKNAYDRYLESHKFDCNGRNPNMNALCSIAVVANAQDYSKSAFGSCMSGAP